VKGGGSGSLGLHVDNREQVHSPLLGELPLCIAQLTRAQENTRDTTWEAGGKRKDGDARGQEGTGTLPFAARITPRCCTMRAFFNVRIPQLQYDR
jgi:hypothetical protein